MHSTVSTMLTEGQIEFLKPYGQTRKTKAEQVLISAGDTSNDFVVVLEGELEAIDDFAGEARTIGILEALA